MHREQYKTVQVYELLKLRDRQTEKERGRDRKKT